MILPLLIPFAEFALNRKTLAPVIFCNLIGTQFKHRYTLHHFRIVIINKWHYNVYRNSLGPENLTGLQAQI